MVTESFRELIQFLMEVVIDYIH